MKPEDKRLLQEVLDGVQDTLHREITLLRAFLREDNGHALEVTITHSEMTLKGIERKLQARIKRFRR